jgi:hypothetical protein
VSARRALTRRTVPDGRGVPKCRLLPPECRLAGEVLHIGYSFELVDYIHSVLSRTNLISPHPGFRFSCGIFPNVPSRMPKRQERPAGTLFG